MIKLNISGPHANRLIPVSNQLFNNAQFAVAGLLLFAAEHQGSSTSNICLTVVIRAKYLLS